MLRSAPFYLLIFCFFAFGGTVLSQSSSTYDILYPTHDIQLDFWQPDTNTNGQGLGEYHINAFPEAWGFDMGCPIDTRQSYIQYDLSSVPFDIGEARLRIHPTRGWPEMAEPYEILYLIGFSGSWDETVVTYNNPPLISYEQEFDLFPSLHESGSMIFVEDASNPYDDIGAWLRDNQPENGGGGIVTIGFGSPAFLGCWADENPDEGGYFFSDKESGLPPMLEVVPEGESLPDIIVTSVEMSDASLSTQSNRAAPVILIVTIGIALLTIGFKKRSRKRA